MKLLVNQKFIIFIGFLLTFLIYPTLTLAHVSVKPSQVGVGERVNFIVGVPTEKDTPTTNIKLLIPEGLQSIRPNVKPGWRVELKKSGEGDNIKVTELTWSGGSIPAEQRDEFIFSAQAPAEEGTLIWKAYQTYGDGEVVAWENDPKQVEGHSDDRNAPKPYSQTKVVNDLKASDTTSHSMVEASQSSNTSMILSVVAMLLAIGALGMQYFKKK